MKDERTIIDCAYEARVAFNNLIIEFAKPIAVPVLNWLNKLCTRSKHKNKTRTKM